MLDKGSIDLKVKKKNIIAFIHSSNKKLTLYMNWQLYTVMQFETDDLLNHLRPEY